MEVVDKSTYYHKLYEHIWTVDSHNVHSNQQAVAFFDKSECKHTLLPTVSLIARTTISQPAQSPITAHW